MSVTRYVYAGQGHLVAENRGGTESYYRNDATGSTTQLYNSSGAITDTFSFDYFGNQDAANDCDDCCDQILGGRRDYYANQRCEQCCADELSAPTAATPYASR
jgi:hypothetical protein